MIEGAITGLQVALLLLAGGVEPASSAPHARVPAALREELAAKASMNANEGSGRYTATTATVMVALVDRIPRGGELKMSQAGLADVVGVSRRTLQRHAVILETGGYITVERARVARDRMATHIYRLSARVESMVYASHEPVTMRQFGAGNKESVVVKEPNKTTESFSGDESTHDAVSALIQEGHDENRARLTVEYAESQANIQNPVGWARMALRNKWLLPPVEEKLRDRARRDPKSDYWAFERAETERNYAELITRTGEDSEMRLFGKKTDKPHPAPTVEDWRWDTMLDQLRHQLDGYTAGMIVPENRPANIDLVEINGSQFVIRVKNNYVMTWCVRFERLIVRLLGDVYGLAKGEARIEWIEAEPETARKDVG